jgi:hypothetical protein
MLGTLSLTFGRQSGVHHEYHKVERVIMTLRILLRVIVAIVAMAATVVAWADEPLFEPVLDLKTLLPQGGGDGGAGLVLNGTFQFEHVGASASLIDDINGDGIADIAVGADPTRDFEEDLVLGYVVFGKDTLASGPFSARIELGKLDGHNGFSFSRGSDFAASAASASVSGAGDVNGDGLGDLVVGTYGFRTSDPSARSATVFVLFGKDTKAAPPFPGHVELSDLNDNDGFAVTGITTDFGSMLQASGVGDVNGDGVDDIAIGAPYASPNGVERAGVTYVIYGMNTSGTMTFPAVLDVSEVNGQNGFVLLGPAATARAGYDVAGAGDVNDDGIADIVIGAPYYGTAGEGIPSAYIVFGRNSIAMGTFPAVLELASLNGMNGFALLDDYADEYENALLGGSVSGAGDVNGDGIADVIMGVLPQGRTRGHAAYVVFGKNTFASGDFPSQIAVTDLDGTDGFAIRTHADRETATTHVSVGAAGDVNADGLGDLVLGMYEEYLDECFGACTETPGAGYVLYGRPESAEPFPATFDPDDLDGGNGFAITGWHIVQRVGHSVSGDYDVNGDRVDDLLIGAPAAITHALAGDPLESVIGAGQANIIFGRGEPPPLPACIASLDPQFKQLSSTVSTADGYVDMLFNYAGGRLFERVSSTPGVDDRDCEEPVLDDDTGMLVLPAVAVNERTVRAELQQVSEDVFKVVDVNPEQDAALLGEP